MDSQAIFVERRKHHRDGVIAELENITYSILRQYDTVSEFGRGAVIAEPIPQ